MPRIGLVQPGDGNAMGIYDERYQYDAVGNFLSFIHRGSNPANPGWTRSYTYNEASQLDAAQVSNRLTSTTMSGSQALVEKYAYDLHGNMTTMPQLQQMQWDFMDQLKMTQRQAVNASDADGTLHQGEQTYYVYNAAGERARKTTASGAGVTLKQRFYLGACEIYQEYDSKGNVTLERQSLHLMDDKRRIALIETTTVDANAVPASLPATTTRYQFSNHLGTASLELDKDAAVISYEEYYPYGSTSYQAGRSVAEVSLKRARRRIRRPGLYYHGARYYAPWLGRWTSPEPLGTKNGTNLYTYVGNQPINRVDQTAATFGILPRGLSISVGIGLAVLAVAAIAVVAFPVVGPALTAAAPYLLAAGVAATAVTAAKWVDSRSSSDPAVRSQADKNLGMAVGGWLVAGASGPISGGMASAASALDEAAAGAASAFRSLLGLEPAVAGAYGGARATAGAVSG